MSKRRVVVTGMGIISPVGNSLDEAWANIIAGKSGVGMVTHFDQWHLTAVYSASLSAPLAAAIGSVSAAGRRG